MENIRAIIGSANPKLNSVVTSLSVGATELYIQNANPVIPKHNTAVSEASLNWRFLLLKRKIANIAITPVNTVPPRRAV